MYFSLCYRPERVLPGHRDPASIWSVVTRLFSSRCWQHRELSELSMTHLSSYSCLQFSFYSHLFVHCNERFPPLQLKTPPKLQSGKLSLLMCTKIKWENMNLAFLLIFFFCWTRKPEFMRWLIISLCLKLCLCSALINGSWWVRHYCKFRH